MYHQQRKLPLILKKSNELVRTQLSVENNALANKIFATLIRHIDENIFPSVSFSAGELIGEDAKGGAEYRKLKKAAGVLMKARIDSLEYDSIGKEIGFTMYNLFASCVYKNGVITAEFTASLKPHLLNLKKHFTPLNYFELIELSSFYSQRLYELLKSWENPSGFVELRLDALYDLISYPKDLRGDFSSLRRKVLEQAERDINGKTGFQFRWEPIKEGRKVVAIRFIIGEQGEKSQKKRQTKKAEKERQERNNAAVLRKPHILAAKACQKKNNVQFGGVCGLMKARSQKCQLCRLTAEVKPMTEEERLFV